MRALLQNVIKNECDKHVERHFEYLADLHDYEERRTRREGISFIKTIKRPPWWDIAPQFNPFKVRTTRKLRTFATTLAAKIRNRSYQPHPAVIHYIRKGDGKRRTLNIFQIPDAAISNLVFKSLLQKNVTRFSAYAYAYREDKTPHDAVNEIFNEWSKKDRVYVAEYDFSRFFDEIDHSYLWRVLDSEGFIVSPEERHVINAFLKSSASEKRQYPTGAKPRERGIPQGTSVSLFLANVACWELDKGLERLGVGFSRYADDTLIWSDEYAKVVRAYYWIDECAQRMGVPLNPSKSYGISLLSRIGKSGELNSKRDVTYLGYRISLNDISISEKKVREIKARINFLAYQNLLQPLKRGVFNDPRLLAGIDLDYVTALQQIRFYLYGGLTEEKLNQYLSGKIRNLNFRGVMSYYPVVTDIKQLARLDGWILYVLKQTLRLRESLWATRGIPALPGPFPGWIDKLDRLGVVVTPSGTPFNYAIPRFTLIHRALRLAISRKGVMAVANASSRYYPAD